MLPFALPIFLGAFLLFQVQPLMGKYILPWFGGAPTVWTTCLLFFQALLLAGYAYAHVSTRVLPVRGQAALHLALLAVALALLPIAPADTWKPADSAEPTARILRLLTASIGLPYFVLSATGPLLQEWFRHLHPGRSPFRLYALANLGSLLALVSYPFWVEVWFSRQAQALGWSWGLGVFAGLCGACAWWVWRRLPGGSTGATVRQPGRLRSSGAAPEGAGEEAAPRPSAGQYLLWLAWPACASVLLLATTNKMCQDIAVVPFLWVAPLGLYLLTFIVCFHSSRAYSRVGFGVALGPVAAAVTWMLFKAGEVPLPWQIAGYGLALLVCGMVCHGELYRLRPHPRFLTAFYLMIALGGALGGLFVAVIAPRLFCTYAELHWGLGACLGLFLLTCARDREGLSARGWRVMTAGYALLACVGLDRLLAWAADELQRHPPRWPGILLAGVDWSQATHVHWLLWLGVGGWVLSRWLRASRRAPALAPASGAYPLCWHRRACLLLAATGLALGTALGRQAWLADRGALSTTRSFYGLLSLWEYRRDEPENHYLLLQHGRITHGLQLVDPAAARWPTTYYGEHSGVGLALAHLPRQEERVLGVVGLGIGTLAAYGQPGDRLRFYEINPDVRRLAEERFTYLRDCPAQVEVVLGDARLSLEREPPQQFDLLALDAFSSDAIPVHLLTREAFELYLRHLKPDGVIAVHISNQYLDLAPVLAGLADHFHLRHLIIAEESGRLNEEADWWRYASTWVLLTREASFLDQPALRAAAADPAPPQRRVPLWTDDHASLFPLLR